MRIFLTVLFLCTSMPSLAADKLTEESIRAFYKEAAAVQLKGEEPAVAFYEKHLHKDAGITLNMIINIQGSPPIKQTLNHDKKSIIKDTRTGYQTGQLQNIENTVLSVKIAADGQSAQVKDTTFGVSIANVPVPGSIQTFDLEQSMLCDGEVIINDQGLIQSKNSTCNVEVTMKPLK